MRKTVLAIALLLVACGDPHTNDDRGYTKAPLERPTVLVQGERPSDMDRLGDPILPDAPIYAAEPDTARPATTTGTAPAPAAQQGPAPAGATAADVSEGQKIFAAAGNLYAPTQPR